MKDKKNLGIIITTVLTAILSMVTMILIIPLSLSLKQTNSTDDLVLIQFDLNDGRESFSQSVVYDTKVIRPEDPERVGYTFDGWYTNDEKWSFVGYTATEDMTFVAKWIPIKYTITYDLNDDDSAYKATNNELNPTYYTIEDEIIFERPSRENSTFVGWSKEKIEKGTTGNLTITADWSVEYFINFDSNGGNSLNSFVTGKGVKVSLPIPERATTDVFVCWFDGENYLPNEYEFTGDADLFAVWQSDFTFTDNGDGTINVTGYVGENQKVVVPYGTVKIEDSAFENNLVITEVFIPESVEEIGNNVFKGCISLTDINLPNSLVYIGNDSFKDCGSIDFNTSDNGLYLGNSKNPYAWFIKAVSKSIPYCNINDSTKHVYDDAFYGCSNLTRVNIPNGVVSLGSYCFYDCRSLKELTIPSTIKEIGTFAFYKCNITKVKTLDLATWCNIKFGDLLSNPASASGDLYLSNELVKSLNIPNGVTKINKYAFYNLKCITSLNVPNSVVEICESAFEGCVSLVNVSLASSVSKLDTSAFNGCIAINFNKSVGGLYLGNKTDEYVWLIKLELSTDLCTINRQTKHVLNTVFDGTSSLKYVYFDGTVSELLAIIGDTRFNYDIVCDDGTLSKKSA